MFSPTYTLGILDYRSEESSEVLALVMTQHPFNVQGGTSALEVYVSGFETQYDNVTQYKRLVSLNPDLLQEAKLTNLIITLDL